MLAASRQIVYPPPFIGVLSSKAGGKWQVPLRSFPMKSNFTQAEAIPGLMGGTANKDSERYKRRGGLHTPNAAPEWQAGCFGRRS
jgi:hypothetical protein